MLFDFGKPKTYYEILNLRPNATNAEVLRAFKLLSAKYEANKNPRQKHQTSLNTRLLNESFAALRTQEGRNRYNRLLLTEKCKPRGFNLKAGNDNKNISNDHSLLSKISNLLLPKSASSLLNKEKNNG